MNHGNKTLLSRRSFLSTSFGLTAAAFMSGCSNWCTGGRKFIDVAKAQPPYESELYTRIGYLLKTWVYQEDGYELKRIDILNAESEDLIQSFTKGAEDWPLVFSDPLQETPVLLQSGPLNANYIPLQLRIPKAVKKPAKITHRLIFESHSQSSEIGVLGGELKPNYDEKVRVIGSPVRGENLVLLNQGSNGYHFNAVFFRDGQPFTGLAYAFDSIQTNAARKSILKNGGSIYNNEAYCNFGQPIVAATPGVVVSIVDRFENQQGHRKSVPITAENLAGNHVIVDIGDGHYALYAHCQRGSFAGFKVGETISVGQPIAKIGNSGNSDGPHLHFEIFKESLDPLWSTGVPFVLEEFTVLAKAESADMDTMSVTSRDLDKPVIHRNAMPEEDSIINIAHV